MATLDVLIPTYQRKTGLAVVLTSLFAQTLTDFHVIISDQTPEEQSYLDGIEIQTIVQALRWRGHEVTLLHHPGLPTTIEDRRYNATALFDELAWECDRLRAG